MVGSIETKLQTILSWVWQAFSQGTWAKQQVKKKEEEEEEDGRHLDQKGGEEGEGEGSGEAEKKEEKAAGRRRRRRRRRRRWIGIHVVKLL